MSDAGIKPQEISDLMRRICVALSNVEAFSADHAVAKKNISGTFVVLSGMLKRNDAPLVISASEKRLLFERVPLEDRNPLIEKLAVRLEEIRANHLSFDPALTEQELMEFYRVLGKGTKYINENGGLAQLLETANVTNIKPRRIDYVMIDEDQRVVSKDATVVDPTKAVVATVDGNIAEYVLQKVLARAEEQQWLAHEMKNNPQRVADLFLEGINLAASRAEMGMTGDNPGLEPLLKNIQQMCSNLVVEQAGTSTENKEQIEQSIISLENEIRARAAHLTSSKVAAGLLTEVLGVIVSYTDRVRARKVANEFVRGEKSLQKTEQLLRKLAPTMDTAESFITRIRQHLVDSGMAAEDVNQIEESLKQEPKPKAKPRPRKKFSEAVSQGVTKRLKELNIEGAQLDKTVESLSSFIEDRARERAGEVRVSLDRVRGELSRRDDALQNLSLGVILWNSDGKAEFVNRAAARALGTETGVDLSAGLKSRLRESSFPRTDSAAAGAADLTETEKKLLAAASVVLKDEKGNVHGIVLKEAPASAAPST